MNDTDPESPSGSPEEDNRVIGIENVPGTPTQRLAARARHPTARPPDVNNTVKPPESMPEPLPDNVINLRHNHADQ